MFNSKFFIILGFIISLSLAQSSVQAQDFCKDGELRATRYCTIAIQTGGPFFGRICSFFLNRAINGCKDSGKICNACSAATALQESVCKSKNLFLCGQLTGVVFNCVSKQLNGEISCSAPPTNPTCTSSDQFGCVGSQL